MMQSENIVDKRDGSLERMKLERFVVAVEGIEKGNKALTSAVTAARADLGSILTKSEKFQEKVLHILMRLDEHLVENGEYLKVISDKVVAYNLPVVEIVKVEENEPQKPLIMCRSCQEEQAESEYVDESGTCFTCISDVMEPKITAIIGLAPGRTSTELYKALEMMNCGKYSEAAMMMVLDNMVSRGVITQTGPGYFPSGDAKTPRNGETKRCSKCKQLLPVDSFSKNSCAKDGLQAYCIECNRVVCKTRSVGPRRGRVDADILNALPIKTEAEKLAARPTAPTVGTYQALQKEFALSFSQVEKSLARLRENGLVDSICINKRATDGTVIRRIFYQVKDV